MWCIPPQHNAEFVYHMENVLEAYKRPYDPRFPLICMDELSKGAPGIKFVVSYGYSVAYGPRRCCCR